MTTRTDPNDHPFIHRPYRTAIALSIPITLALVAEPVTALVDTAFVARLGAVPLAALGVGAILISTLSWVFNFLGISIQTEVATALGSNNRQRAGEMVSLALMMAAFFGGLVMLVSIPAAAWLSTLLGADGAVQTDAAIYIRYRMLGFPALLIMLTVFGTMRGEQDMRTPLIIAVGVNALNILLDWLLIFGIGPLPALGIGGAALATSLSQWLGALWALRRIVATFGFRPYIDWGDVRTLLTIGGDLFIRTGLLTLVVLLMTRVSNQISPQAGAAHRAIQTVILFMALALDGFGITGQSLVAYFLGSGQVERARQAAAVCTKLGLIVGLVLMTIMLAGTNLFIALLVPPTAVALFVQGWWIAAISQPAAALTFATDGIHWGTGDYRYLRNAMIVGAVVSIGLLAVIDPSQPGAFALVWWASPLMLAIRAVFGVGRIWPGIGVSRLRAASNTVT